jgi:hypothetical protein
MDTLHTSPRLCSRGSISATSGAVYRALQGAEMNEQDYEQMAKALALLQDYMTYYGCKMEDYKTLSDAEGILKGLKCFQN